MSTVNESTKALVAELAAECKTTSDIQEMLRNRYQIKVTSIQVFGLIE